MNNWIKCSERLPDQDVPVLVFSITELVTIPDVFIAYIDNNYGRPQWEAHVIQVHGYELKIARGFQPTHWQPLPEVPSE